MGILTKFQPIIFSIKVDSQHSLNPLAILSIIYHFQIKFPKDEILYSYFPKDPRTDWFKGYGFIHFQPYSMRLQIERITANLKKTAQKRYDKKIGVQDDHNQDILHELERFKLIKNNPIQEIPILNTHDLLNGHQLRLTNFIDLNSQKKNSDLSFPSHSYSDTSSEVDPSIFSHSSIKCFVELSQSSNLNSSGIRSSKTSSIIQPALNTDQLKKFTKAFYDLGGFKNLLN